jgi:hypothetical protein
MDYEDVKNFRMSNLAARQWYNEHVAKIPEIINKSQPLEQQAKQAFDLRNEFKAQTRDLMKDQGLRKKLDADKPTVTFEEKVADKMSRKGLTREEAFKDIIKTSAITNKTVNGILGVEA